MSDFAHVENQRLRELLENGWDGDEDSICQALTYSAKCVDEDETNEFISSEIYCARSMELEYAEISWNEEGDGFAAVDHLRKLWSV
jgi:hypothetical protein